MVTLNKCRVRPLSVLDEVVIFDDGDQINHIFALIWVHLIHHVSEVGMLLAQRLPRQIVHPVPGQVERLVLEERQCVGWLPWAPLRQIVQAEGVELRGQELA